MDQRCNDCMWAYGCGYERPCRYYTPDDYEDRIAKREEQRRKTQFYTDWIEYIEYWDDESDGH